MYLHLLIPALLCKSGTLKILGYFVNHRLMFQKQWQDAIMSDDRLSLTLEEIVHIRSVLTKAELEVLPVEGRVKEDVEKRRVSHFALVKIFIFDSFTKLPHLHRF